MRILQIIPQSRIGGAESVGFLLAAEEARRGHPTLLLSNRANGPLLERPRPPDMEVAALKRSSRLDARILPFLLKRAARFRPDVIHAHTETANFWARLVGLAHPRAAVLCHVHSSRFVGRRVRGIRTDRLLAGRADAVLTVNEIQRDFLQNHVGVRPERLHVVPNGVDTDRFAPPPGMRQPHAAVCVASLTDVKNHAGLLRAWGRVAAAFPDARLTLVGDGPLRESLERQATAAGLAPSVRFAGLQQDVRPFLWEASVFVLFSHLEALPLSLLEAMAAGCACVVSAVGGMPGVVVDGKSGLLVPVGSPRAAGSGAADFEPAGPGPERAAASEAALAEALLRLFQNGVEREALAAGGREEIIRRFSLDAWVDRILKLSEECARRRSGRPLEAARA